MGNEESEIEGAGVRYDQKNPIKYPQVLRNIKRKDKIVNSDEEVFIHLCCSDSNRPLVKQITAGRLVVDKKAIPGVITPDLFIFDNSYAFLFLYNRYKRYGMEVLYDNCDIPNTVLEAFDVINNTIDSEQAKMYKTEKKSQDESKNKSNRKSLPKT